MTDAADAEDTLTLVIPMAMAAELFEPWDGLDAAIDGLERETRTNGGLPARVGSIVAAREALRAPLYAVLRAYQAAVREAEAEEGEEAED